jgi:peptidoglycan hydrolase-like protein with peptidoglycan-binding domain
MSTSDERLRMAASILDFEARRDRQGRLQIYKLPPGDGGGTYEVAGINDRYHPQEAEQLAALINAGRYDEAEQQAKEIIATYTDFVTRWTTSAAVECYLRDCGFNRGPRGAARILQRAVGAVDDGIVGNKTLALVAEQEQRPLDLLRAMRGAREQYERDVAHRDESSKFWKGLVNRWNKALEVARSFLPAGLVAALDMAAEAAPAPFDASQAAIANAMAAGNPPSGAVPTATLFMSSNPVLSAPQTPVTLPALRIGSQGDLVRAWQSFLTGQGFDPGGLDGFFGDKTAAATQAFQSKFGLTADGVAGRQTLMKAMTLGFELIQEPAADITGSNFPPRPNFPPLENTAARQAVFGRFDFVPQPEPGNPENIRILGTWEQDNIIMVALPQLRLALGAGAPAGMQFHRMAADQLKGMWAEWQASNLLNRILSFDGSFVPRFIRGSTTNLSNHAFGSAFDINADENTLGARPPLVGERGSTRELVPIANKWGFYWGGHFGSRPDGMHFEIAFLKQ